MNQKIFKYSLLFLFIIGLNSCAGRRQAADNTLYDIPFSPPPPSAPPAIRIIEHKNQEEGASVSPWLRTYLQNGISGVEAMQAYQGSYVFIAGIYNSNRQVVNQWLTHYSVERDFPRLVAQRICARLDRDLTVDPYYYYGTAYEQATMNAYRTAFGGGKRTADTWVRGSKLIWDEDGEVTTTEGPYYWGFIVISVPKDVLETQVTNLLQNARNTGTGTREQNAAFDQVRERFFDRF